MRHGITVWINRHGLPVVAGALILGGCSWTSDQPNPRPAENNRPAKTEEAVRQQAATRTPQLQQINTAEGLALLNDPQVQVLDIRTVGEFQSGTLNRAHNAVWGSPQFQEQLAVLDRKQPILLFCRSGNRSTQSLPILSDLGFTTIYHLQDGIRLVPREHLVTPDLQQPQ